MRPRKPQPDALPTNFEPPSRPEESPSSLASTPVVKLIRANSPSRHSLLRLRHRRGSPIVNDERRLTRPPHSGEGDELPNKFAEIRVRSLSSGGQPASRLFDYSQAFVDVRIAYGVRDPGRISNVTHDRERGKWPPRWLPDDHVFESAALYFESNALSSRVTRGHCDRCY